MARAPRRLRLPVLQPDAGPHGAREHRAAAAAHEAVAPRARAQRARLRSSSSGWPIARSTSPRSCRAASSSAWPSRARSWPIRRCSSCDEPTGDLDRETADEILGLLQLLNRNTARRSSWSRTIRARPTTRRGASMWTKARSSRHRRSEPPLRGPQPHAIDSKISGAQESAASLPIDRRPPLSSFHTDNGDKPTSRRLR